MQYSEQKKSEIIITGALGFIGSCMAKYLIATGYQNLILVDKFNLKTKKNNWTLNHSLELVDYENLFEWLNYRDGNIDAFIHLGAHTDTIETNYDVYEKLNVQYSKDVWKYCSNKQIPLIYASSAATYGLGEHGYEDSHEIIEKLKPLNSYGISKNEFDKWVIRQQEYPPLWAGLKFFNVYGPNECNKRRMASVVWHSFRQINKDGSVKLFKSHRYDVKDGDQCRDFIYVKDLLKIMSWMLTSMSDGEWQSSKNGLYNIGTGEARSFYHLACATFKALNRQPNIYFIDMPQDMLEKYQYFTKANVEKLRNAGYRDEFYKLEDGINDYVKELLQAQA